MLSSGIHYLLYIEITGVHVHCPLVANRHRPPHPQTSSFPNIILNTGRWAWMFPCCLLIIFPLVSSDKVEWISVTQSILHAVTHIKQRLRFFLLLFCLSVKCFVLSHSHLLRVKADMFDNLGRFLLSN